MDKIIDALEILKIPDSDFFGVSHETKNLYERTNEKIDQCIGIVKNIEQPIYEVLVYSHPWHLDEHNFIDFGSAERVGFYYEEEIAIRAIEENWCDLQDHYARAAAVRTIKPGLYQYPPFNTYIYYLWNSDLKQFKRAEIPEEVGDFC